GINADVHSCTCTNNRHRNRRREAEDQNSKERASHEPNRIDHRTVVLLASDTLNVNDVFLAVDLRNFAIALLEGNTNNLHFIVLANRYGADLEIKAKQSKACVE